MVNANLDKPERWSDDTIESVRMYNEWFTGFAPAAFRKTRLTVADKVSEALGATNYLRNISPRVFAEFPHILPTLRMCTCPPLARDRLVGLAHVRKALVDSMEYGHRTFDIEFLTSSAGVFSELERIADLITLMADLDIFVWLKGSDGPSPDELSIASMVVADRLCAAETNPIIRNAQEARQLQVIETWLISRRYTRLPTGHGKTIRTMPPGTYSFRMNVPVGNGKIPIDAVIKPFDKDEADLPLLVEAKSAGDVTNVNKRRKEEAQKLRQLKEAYGSEVRFCLFLCGYFDRNYLSYEADEGIDWVWEHRVEDFLKLGL